MKLTRKITDNYFNERINIFQKQTPCLDSSWHYHPQYELLYVSKGTGIRFIGDHVSSFFPGELVLVGAYLPHLWKNSDAEYQDNPTKKVNKIILQFNKDFLSQETFHQAEFTKINQLLHDAKLGISFGQSISPQIHQQLLNMVDASPTSKLIELLSLLHTLSITKDRSELSSTDMRQYSDNSSDRLESVIKYISDNYMDSITLKDVADIACLTTNSFCRFFKKETNKSFSQFLTEVRIKNAARLLIQGNMPISEVSYKVGYHSLTNFYRQFKLIMGKTPKEYRLSI